MAQIRLFIAGDSTAQNYPKEQDPFIGWGQLLPLYFDSEVEIRNHAMAGRSLKSFYNEGRFQAILDEAGTGDYLIIQFGHNDGSIEKPERYISFPDFSALLEKEYLAPAIEKGMIPILASHTQTGDFDPKTGQIPEPAKQSFSSPEELTDRVEGYPALLEKAAKDRGLLFFDIRRLSRELENSLGEAESQKMHIHFKPGEHPRYPEGVKDTTHFRYAGAFRIAGLVAKELERIPAFAAHRIQPD